MPTPKFNPGDQVLVHNGSQHGVVLDSRRLKKDGRFEYRVRFIGGDLRDKIYSFAQAALERL